MRNKTMNNVHATMTAVIVSSSLFATGFAGADFQGFSIDEIDGGWGFGTTYRVYANVDAGDQLNAVFGDGVDPLSISTTTSFYQHAGGGATVANQTDFMLGIFPSLAYDSYVTIGLDNAEGNAMLDIGIDWTIFESGADLETSNGSWFATPDDAQVFEVNGRVLIGQFTTTGELSGIMNIQGKNSDLTNWQYRGVELPAPGIIALLGIAGIAARRRRQ